MAQLLKQNGEVILTSPAKGKKYELEQLQECVGGYVEMLYRGILFDIGMCMAINEEAVLRGDMQYNILASDIAGRPIYGDVLYCLAKEID